MKFVDNIKSRRAAYQELDAKDKKTRCLTMRCIFCLLLHVFIRTRRTAGF